MLINKKLLQFGFIFVNNINLKYLKYLVDLGSYPILIKIENNKRIPIIIMPNNIKTNKYTNIFMITTFITYENQYDFEKCSVSDIKNIIQECKKNRIIPNPILYSNFPVFYILDYFSEIFTTYYLK